MYVVSLTIPERSMGVISGPAVNNMSNQVLIVRPVMSRLTLPCTIDAVRGRRHRFLETLLKASGVAAERISIRSKQTRSDFHCF